MHLFPGSACHADGFNKGIMKNQRKAYFWVGVSPWMILGPVLILVPIFVFMTIQALNRQKEATVRLLSEKGAALIRSFEAGTRMGLKGMYGEGFKIQRLLMETAQQPDIVYLLVTDLEGTVLAHNDLARIGRTYGTDLDLGQVSRAGKVGCRQVGGSGDLEVFEVFRRFEPIRKPAKNQRGMARGEFRIRQDSEGVAEKLIFIGLDMATVEAARKEDVRHTLIMALTLLLVGFAGMVTLFLAQAYRTTRTSLSRVQAFSDNLVKNMPIGLLAVDGEGHIASFNQTAESILQMPNSEVLGKAPEAVLPIPFRGLGDELKRDGRLINREIACQRADGVRIPLEIIATAIEDERRSHQAYAVLFRDLSEIRRLKEEVARSQRLASIGRLAAGVAHEIRNPLSSIKGFATYFKHRYKDVPEDQNTAEIMIQEVERLNRVIGELLEFARPMHLQNRRVDVKELIAHSSRLIQGDLAGKRMHLDVRLPSDIATVSVDPDRVNQVLLNLYLNAMDAMGDGGALSVDVRRPTGTNDMEIVVADTGSGIGEADLAQIFDPYFTTKSSGTGLGLAIVHKIMEAHGGEVRVRSNSGRGTTVTLYFPDSAEV
ncbi:MAG: PAS domain-containing protein [Deltaproteobacteria bacterium]|nr:PAS domain-containing protein [Deltaproteobacteria bacterium]